MRFFIIALTTLTLMFGPNGLILSIQTDTPRHLYVQLDASGGAVLNAPQIYEFDLQPGETFTRIIPAYGPGTITASVWEDDGGIGPAASATVQLPTHRLYIPLAAH
jgi:hypothetical protein